MRLEVYFRTGKRVVYMSECVKAEKEGDVKKLLRSSVAVATVCHSISRTRDFKY